MSVATHNTIQLLDASRSILDRCHSDKTKPSGTIRLLKEFVMLDKGKIKKGDGANSLVINNGDFFNSSKSTEFLIQVSFLGSDAEAEHPKYIRRIGRLLGHVSKTKNR